MQEEISMEIGLWNKKTNRKIKELIDEHATSTRRTEEEIEKDIRNIDSAEKQKNAKKIEQYLKDELGLEKSDLSELEQIKEYVELVEENKLKELASDEQIINKLKEKHGLGHEHAANLMHKIRLIRKYVIVKSAATRKKEAEIAREAI